MKTLILIMGLPEGSTLNLYFGISENRADIIDNHINGVSERAYQNETPVPVAQVIAEAVSIAENDNELAYISFGLGFQAAQQMNNPLANLAAMLSSNEGEEE